MTMNNFYQETQQPNKEEIKNKKTMPNSFTNDDDEITLGWFVGDKNQWYLETLSLIIEKLSSNYQMSKEELIEVIGKVFEKVNPTSEKDMGLIMKEVSPKLKGRTDMSNVNAIIREKLSNL